MVATQLGAGLGYGIVLSTPCGGLNPVCNNWYLASILSYQPTVCTNAPSSSPNKGAANAGVCGGYLGYKFGVGAECRGEANGLSEVVFKGVKCG